MRNGPSAANLTSVTETRALLVEICEEPGKFVGEDGIVVALSSQGKLARLEVPEREILKVSLNALKRAATVKFERGFVELDELRVAALAALEKHAALLRNPSGRSIAGLSEKVSGLEEELACAREDCDLLTYSFHAAIDAARQALKCVTLDDAREHWQKSSRELFASLSLARRYDKSTSNDQAKRE